MRNTEILIPFELVKKNRDKIVSKISEGCKELERLLNDCIDLDIQTIACCAGHGLQYKPYIYISYDTNTRKKINAFLNKLKDIKGIEITFSTTGYTNNPFSIAIYTKMNNRDKVFSVIAQSLEENNESDYLDENISVALRLAINMDYCFLGTAMVTLYNRSFQKKYMIDMFNFHKNPVENIMDKYSDKEKQKYEVKYYLCKTKEKLEIISDKIEELFPNFYLKNGFKISSHISFSEKVDMISEYKNENNIHSI